MTTSNSFTKDPEAILDYTEDWTDWLADGDQLSEADVDVVAIQDDVDPLVVDQFSSTTTTITAWLSGGTIGNVYTVTMTIRTTGVGGGPYRVDQRSIKVKVKQR